MGCAGGSGVIPPVVVCRGFRRGQRMHTRSSLKTCILVDTMLLVEYEVIKSATFLNWLKGLRDRNARARVAVRIDRIEDGNFGDHRSVGGGVSEIRVNVGQGYRIYYTIRNRIVVILLCGGDKSSQRRDIRRARQMESEL